MERMMASFLEQAGEAAFKRGFEEWSEPLIEESLRNGLDENETAKRIIRSANRIPGFRLATHALAKTLGELFTKHAENLWPNDHRPSIAVLRQVLKALGPAMSATTDATTDVLERIANTEVDKVISARSVATAERKGQFDQGVFLWPDEFPGKILIPAKNPDQSIRLDAQSIPIILDPKVMERRHSERYTRSTSRSVGQGKDRKTVTDPPVRPNIIGPFALSDAVQMIDMERFAPEDAQAIRALLAPKAGYYQSWGDDLWEVYRAYNATFVRRKAETGYDWLSQRESEGLVQTMLKSQPDVTLLRELVGKRFKSRIGQNGARPGELSLEDVDELEQVVMDMWLGGEQPREVQIVRAVRRVWRSAAFRGASPLKATLAVLSLSTVIWIPLLVCFVIFLTAAQLYVQAVLQDLHTVANTFFWGSFDGYQFALFASVASAWMLFGFEQLMKLFRTATAWIGIVFPAWTSESMTSSLRKIRIFGFVLPGLNGYLVALGVPSDYRLLVALPVGFAIAIGSMLVDAGYLEDVNNAVRRAAKPMTLVLVSVPLVLIVLFGYFAGLTAGSRETWSGAKILWSLLTGHWYGKLVLLALGALTIGGLLNRSEIINDGTVLVPNPARWVYKLVLLVGVVTILFSVPCSGKDWWNSQVESSDVTVEGPGSNKLRIKTQTYEDGSVRTQTKGRLQVKDLPPPRVPIPNRKAEAVAPKAAEKDLTTSLTYDTDVQVHYAVDYGSQPERQALGGYAPANTGYVPGQGFVSDPTVSTLPALRGTRVK